MAKWGQCDFRELKKLEERLEQLEKVDMDELCRQGAKKIAQMLLNKVKKRTPVGVVPDDIRKNRRKKVSATGTSGKTRKFFSREAAIYHDYWNGYKGGSLRDAWTILPIEKQGQAYTVTIINNLEYASYVEYGHRQTPGRYVPALGKRLKAGWVKGRFMLTISRQEVETLAPRTLEKLLREALKGVFD